MKEKVMVYEDPRMGFNPSNKQCVNWRSRSCTPATRPESSPRDEEMWGRQPQIFTGASSVSLENVHSLARPQGAQSGDDVQGGAEIHT